MNGQVRSIGAAGRMPVLVLAAAMAWCAADAVRAQDTVASVYVAVWPAQAGQTAVPRDELWIDAGRAATWRRVRERRVIASAAVAAPRDLVARLVSAARSGAPHETARGGPGGVDTPLAPYVSVVVGNTREIIAWGDEEPRLPTPLVDAAHALMRAAAPPNPAAPAASFWVQAVPVGPPILDLLEAQGAILTLTSQEISSQPVLTVLARFPHAFAPLGTGSLVVGRTTLGDTNPAVAVRLEGRAVQLVLQASAP